MSREDIKSAALKLFKRYSYVKTTVADIASVAGIGKGSVYLVYKTKDDILFSLIDDSIQEIKVQYAPWFSDESTYDNHKSRPINHTVLRIQFSASGFQS